MNGDLGRACARGLPALDAVAPRPVGSPPAPRRPPAPGGGCRRLRARRRGRGGSGEGRGEGGFLPPHTQSRSRIYRVSRSGAERREQFPSGWSTSRSLGEGPGFRAALVEPHPSRRSRYSRVRSPAAHRARASEGRVRAGVAGEGGLGRGGGRGGSPLGARQGGREAGREQRSVFRGSADWRCPRPIPRSAGGLGELGAGRARQGGARRGGNGCVWARPARVNIGNSARAVGGPRERGSRPGLGQASLSPRAIPRERVNSGATCSAVPFSVALPALPASRFPTPESRPRTALAPA